MKPMQDQETCMSSEEVVCAHVSSKKTKKNNLYIIVIKDSMHVYMLKLHVWSKKTNHRLYWSDITIYSFLTSSRRLFRR